MDGILNINKPKGMTSYGVVALVKRLTHERRVGHAGTLDPMACGVLPVCLGRGTRVVEFLAEAKKVYRAEIELGLATDTYDAGGRVTQRGDASGISRRQLKSALGSFRGRVMQRPPMYSAVRYQGRRLYELARAGITVLPPSRPAEIYRLELRDFGPPLVTLEVECGKGTYIRSLAHDLGQALGCGGHLKSLVRLGYGLFNIESAVTLPQLETACCHGYWRQLVYPPDIVLCHWPAVVLSDDKEQFIRHGRPLYLEADGASFDGRCRAYSQDGCFLAVLDYSAENGQWHPVKVFSGWQ